jgi:predicted transposase/invertase (TIGR01784 family)
VVQRRNPEPGHWSVRPRLAYYAASLYVDQLTSGSDYTALAPAITICFLKEVLCPESDQPHLRFVLSDRAAGVVLTDRLQVHTIELPKYNFEGPRLDSAATQLQSAQPLVQWAFFLSRAAELEAADLKRLLPQRESVKATGVVEMIGQTPEERMQYRARQKAEMDFQTLVNVVRNEAREEGREEGLEQGREEGHKQGLVEQVQLLQELLGEPVPATVSLSALEHAPVEQLVGDLKLRLRTRQS